MFKKEIKFTDYNGKEREKEFYFNISRAEFAELEYSVKGGFSAYIDKIREANDTVEVMKAFKKLLELSVGVKSDDGVQFIKSKEISDEFFQSEAYSEFIMELIENPDLAGKFIEGISSTVKVPEETPKEPSKVS